MEVPPRSLRLLVKKEKRFLMAIPRGRAIERRRFLQADLAAGWSCHRDSARIYRRATSKLFQLPCRMIALSNAFACAAEVAKPLRSECAA
jgi:hypothetical protein